jgi:hypothetical protein
MAHTLAYVQWFPNEVVETTNQACTQDGKASGLGAYQRVYHSYFLGTAAYRDYLQYVRSSTKMRLNMFLFLLVPTVSTMSSSSWFGLTSDH